MNYGLIVSPKDPNAYVLGGFGSLPKVILQPDGQWDSFLPIYEPQKESFESCGCTIWGTQNCIETMVKKITGVEQNYSERFNYILAGVSCPGADPHMVCESIRSNNVINQSRLPMVASLQDFLMPNPVPAEYLIEAQLWPFIFQHEWVIQGEDQNWKEKMMEALQYSPLGVGVFAWKEKDGLYVRPEGAPDVHWCEVFGYVEGQYWKCFDSYDHSIKYLDWNFGFKLVKRFHLMNKNEIIPKDNWLVELIKNFLKIFKWS